MKSFFLAGICLVTYLPLSYAGVAPDIEHWPIINHTENMIVTGTSDKEWNCNLYHKNPSKKNSYGITKYMNSQCSGHPFIKAWHWTEKYLPLTGFHIDATESYSAMQLEDGKWVLGDKGEEVAYTIIELKSFVFIYYYFTGDHGDTYRIIKHPKPAQTQKRE